MSFDNVQALPPGTRLGDYRLDAMIGHGGFGITYRAFDAQLAKVVAIKEYLPLECAIRQADGQVVPRSARLADDFAWGRERFLDEARALARFRHPISCRCCVTSRPTARPIPSWSSRTARTWPSSCAIPAAACQPTTSAAWSTDCLRGLGAVHAQGFLHRDIKPANIIIRRDGVPILVDFGAARQAMGGRSRSLTGVLTPQYAPIEQYALDGKQGPWSDIYSAAAVLYHAIAGQVPPDAAARVGKDPYRRLAETEGDRFAPAFLAAIDRAMAFAPADRPQSVEAWSALFGAALPKVQDAPTQRLAYGAGVAPPRLGSASREIAEPPVAPPRSRSRWRSSGARVWIVVVVMAALTLWRFQPEIRTLLAGARTESVATPTAQLPAVPPAAQSQAAPPPAAPDTSKAIIEQAQRAAAEARLVLERADEASRAARSMAGEARIVAARAARPDLERAERLSYDPGASYIGQVADGKRQGLGVADLANGERQAGVWQADQVNGLGTVRLADDTRYAGQWRDGQSTGLGVREKPGVERAEGNFVMGRLEGLGVRRTLAERNVVQSGEFHGDALEGPGVETVGDRERYEGGFRAGKRNGYGQVTLDGKVQSGRWQDGKPIETAP